MADQPTTLAALIEAQAEALGVMLNDKGLSLNAVLELAVDEGILLERIEKRASQTAGGPRADDNASALRKRLEVYRAQTTPLVDYYSGTGLLKTVDGMQSIEGVAAAIDAALSTVADA